MAFTPQPLSGTLKPLLRWVFAVCLGLLSWTAQAQKQQPAIKQPSEVLFIDTLRSVADLLEVDEDTLLTDTERQLDSLAEGDMRGYVPKVSMELLQDRLGCIEREMPLTLNKRVASFIDYFVVRNRNYTQTMLERKDVYFPLFERKLKEYGLPEELKHLSIVESGLNYGAISKSGAVGLWQFMSFTGRDMGLRLDHYYDERMDPEKATDAACRYLKMLYRVFGDWELVLASYNCGLGKIKGVMNKTGKKKFWDMYDALPVETRAYVPQFVALTYAVNYAADHHIYPDADSLLTTYETDTAMVDRYVDLTLLAEQMDFEPKEMKRLNPALRRGATPHNEPYAIRMPKEVKAYFAEYRQELLDSASMDDEMVLALNKKNTPLIGYKLVRDRKSSKTYKVRRGEGLALIARKFNTTVDELMSLNQLPNQTVKRGQILVIRASSTAIAKADSIDGPKLAATKRKGRNKVYKVQNGDTLWTIAQKYQGITPKDIIRLNKLRQGKIYPGQRLIIG